MASLWSWCSATDVNNILRRLSPASLLALNRPPDQALTPAQVESNIRHLVGDIAWFGFVWGSLIAFLQVYTVRLGASGLLVSAITYGPALVAIFWQIPAGRLMVRSGKRMSWVIGSGLVYRAVFLTIALLPFLLDRGVAQATALVWVLSAFASSFSNVSFLSMMADAVPPDRLQQLVGWRIAAFGLTSTITTLLAGPLLRWLPFPLNYQVLFLLGFLGSMVSWWHVHQVRVPDRPPQSGTQPAFWRELGEMLRFPGYMRFLIAIFALQMALGMIGPLLPLYWVRSLDTTDQQVSLILSTATAVMVVGSLSMRRLVRRIGRERALAMGALGYALYPLLTALTTSVWWLIPWAAISGFFTAAITVNVFDNLVSVTPEADRTNYMSVYNTVQNSALFVGPVIAGVIAESAGGPGLGLKVAAGVALIAGVLMALRQARPA